MSSIARAMLTAGALSLIACAGEGDSGGSGGVTSDRGGSGSSRGGNGGGAAGAGGAAAGSGGTPGRGGQGGSSSSAGSSGGGGAGAWDCLDVPGTLCICYARAGMEATKCSTGYACCFLLNATSCECFVAAE